MINNSVTSWGGGDPDRAKGLRGNQDLVSSVII